MKQTIKTWYTPGGGAPLLCLDMLKQPHILIAGSTGSGKSVLLNALVYTALYNSPGSVQFILIDPKGNELSDYAELPHTIGHYKKPADILQALNGAADLMDERFDTMDKLHQKQSTEPHIYILIDEYVDIKFLIGKPAETALIRIAAKGRAANIHIVLCTQRPTRDIINGAIRANFSSKLGLRTDSKQESRNIFDVNCCEDLPMYGYGYYKTPAYKTPQLVEISMIQPEELAARVKWWTDQKDPPRRHWWQR